MPSQRKREGLAKLIREKSLVVGVAVLVCATLLSTLWVADTHHDSIWVLLVWNSIGLVAAVGWSLRRHWRKASFIAFFAAWLVLHAAVTTFLMGWVPILYWAPAIALELFVGYFIAYGLFGLPLNDER
jgi:hypothetical protein